MGRAEQQKVETRYKSKVGMIALSSSVYNLPTQIFFRNTCTMKKFSVGGFYTEMFNTLIPINNQVCGEHVASFPCLGMGAWEQGYLFTTFSARDRTVKCKFTY